LFWLCGETGETVRTTAGYEQHAVEDFPRLFNFLLERDIYLGPSPYEVGFLSAAHTENDIDALINACSEYTKQTC
jgi:glutamate-1-semialdehyde 2,1-aminomutase